MKKKRISKQEREFAQKWVECGKPGQAYKFAFATKGLSEIQISSRANAVRKRPQVRELILNLQNKLEKEAEFGIKQIIEIWTDIATADPNELMSNLRRCCRYCYGCGHHYQWKDAAEFAFAFAQAMGAPVPKGGKRMPLPQDTGGYGFNFTYRPHPECTQCKGEGIMDTFFADTRKLSRKGARLYAGVKQTQNGMQVMTRDQDAALANLAKFFGMFTEKVQVTGAGGGPLLSANVELPVDPSEAANLYAALMKRTARE